MEKERSIEVAKAYNRIVKPWTSLGLEPPSITITQVAREAGIRNISTLADELDRSGIIFDVNGGCRNRLVLEDSNGESIENLEVSARNAAPYKRAVKEADYRSRAPGGGPVVKRRVNEKNLNQKLVRLGKGRLRVNIEPYDKNEEILKKRNETKQRLETRWVGRPSIENDPLLIKTERAFSVVKKISERKGVANETELKNRLRLNLEDEKPQIILAIWGPPYENQGNQNVFFPGSPEEKMARGIIKVLGKLNPVVETKLIILYADYYGSVINSIPSDDVNNYGQQIRERFKNIGELFFWTEVKKENLSRYEILKSCLTDKKIKPNEKEIERALIMQNKLGVSTTEEMTSDSATTYRTERLVEGRLLTEGFIFGGNKYNNIIKLATAPSRSNDEAYETNLPRFYVFGMPRAAWNTPR